MGLGHPDEAAKGALLLFAGMTVGRPRPACLYFKN